MSLLGGSIPEPLPKRTKEFDRLLQPIGLRIALVEYVVDIYMFFLLRSFEGAMLCPQIPSAKN
jgi:hypothetical protein